MASHKAARRAAELGFTRVFVMEEGIDGWARAGHQVATGKQ